MAFNPKYVVGTLKRYELAMQVIIDSIIIKLRRDAMGKALDLYLRCASTIPAKMNADSLSCKRFESMSAHACLQGTTESNAHSGKGSTELSSQIINS